MSALTDSDIREALGLPTGIDRDAEPGAQGSIEWLYERVGHVTCSRFGDVLDFTKDRVTKGRISKSGKVITPSKVIPGAEGAKRAMYRKEIVIERITGKPIEHFVSKPMLDGIEREPFAKLAYEARTGAMLRDYGFKRHPTLAWIGGSPDALIGDDGGLECKCPTPTTHLDTLLDGMDAEHMPQVQGLIWLFGADWWDFVSYCPLFEEPLRTYIQRIPRDQQYIDALEGKVLDFLAEVSALLRTLGQAA